MGYAYEKEHTMNVELFVLCDAATDYHGKLNILGAYDTIWARNLPAVHPLCAVAIRIRFAKIEEGEHKIRINIIDADGKSILKPVEMAAKIQFREDMTSMAANMILNLQGIKFEHFGEYSVDLAVDSRHEASLPLFINQAPAQAWV